MALCLTRVQGRSAVGFTSASAKPSKPQREIVNAMVRVCRSAIAMAGILRAPIIHMSFEFQRRKHIERELSKKARQELRTTAEALTVTGTDEFVNAVHESRKRLQKVRAVVAL